jgi:hypothetical protein
MLSGRTKSRVDDFIVATLTSLTCSTAMALRMATPFSASSGFLHFVSIARLHWSLEESHSAFTRVEGRRADVCIHACLWNVEPENVMNMTSSDRRKANHDRVTQFVRGAPPPKSAMEEGKKAINELLAQEVKRRRQWREKGQLFGEQVYSPFLTLLSSSPSALAALDSARKTFSDQRESRVVLPPQAPVSPRLISGSITSVNVPPYENQYVWMASPPCGMEDVGADEYNGTLGGLVWSDEGVGPQAEGNADGCAGFGCAFTPLEDGLLNVFYQLNWGANWAGHAMLLIQEYDSAWELLGVPSVSYYPLWNDSTGWDETHYGGTNGTLTTAPMRFEVSADNRYGIWVILYAHADGRYGFDGLASSRARCWFSASLPFMLIGTA